MAKKQWDEAIAEYRKAIDLSNRINVEAHFNLAQILRLQGQLSASLDFFKRGHALGSKRKDWHYPSAQWVANAERLVRLEAKLLDVLAGKATATDNGERLGLLEVCRLQRRHVAAARLYADAFTADPKLADDLKATIDITPPGAPRWPLRVKGRTQATRQPGTKPAAPASVGLAAGRPGAVEQTNWRAAMPEDRQAVRTTLEHAAPSRSGQCA